MADDDDLVTGLYLLTGFYLLTELYFVTGLYLITSVKLFTILYKRWCGSLGFSHEG